MRYAVFIMFLLLASCQGKLTGEQREQIKEDMKNNEIKKISDAEITEAAFSYGRKISSLTKVINPNLENAQLIDSLENIFKVTIHSLEPGDSMLLEVEQQLIEAYLSGSDTLVLSDNVQKIGNDSMLYTVPVLKENPDGSNEFNYALGIRISKKQVILSMDN